MGTDWPKVRLGDHIETCLGKMLDKKKNEGSFHPYLGNKSVRWGSFNLEELSEMRFQDHEHEKYGLRYGDLVVCEGGEPGRCAIWKDEVPNMKFQKALHRIRPKDELDVGYLFYWLTFNAKVGRLDAFFTGTTIKHLTGRALVELDVELPAVRVQKSIAHILGTLDDKIELNRRMNVTLESMARALFKSWFVDFDPVIDNALAAGNPIPEPLSARAQTRRDLGTKRKPLLKNIQKLFPDAFVFDNDVGWIPSTWEVDGLPNVIDFLEGPGIRNWQYTEDEDGCKFINIRCIKDGDLSLATANKITSEEAFGKYSHFQLAKDDIVISTSGTLGRFAFVREEHLPLSLNTSVIRFRKIPDVSTIHYIAGYAATKLQWELETRASGSVQKNFGPMHLKKISMLCPPFAVLRHHDEIADELFRKRQDNLKNTDCLIKLRDTLLPKLLSGELRIPDAEKLVASSL